MVKKVAANTLNITTSGAQAIDTLTLTLAYTADESALFVRSNGVDWDQIFPVDPIPVGIFLGLVSSTVARVKLVVP